MELNSKDLWYCSIICIVGSIVTSNFFGGALLFFVGTVSCIAYFIKRGRERHERRIAELNKNMEKMAAMGKNMFVKVFGLPNFQK